MADLDDLNRWLAEMPDEVAAVLPAAVGQAGRMLETAVKARASGRPGPNAPTGAYRRSITTVVERLPEGARARVGTNAPQARRLEFGFTGTDALGRVYDQPPYPHFEPAIQDTEDRIVEFLANVVGAAIERNAP